MVEKCVLKKTCKICWIENKWDNFYKWRCVCIKCDHKRRNPIIKKNKELWLCADCSDVKEMWIYCEKHYIIRKLKNNNIKHLWVDWYYSQLEKQKYKCFHTWVDIKIWINDSIEHLVPISRWWNNEQDNIVICDLHFNKMKLDYSIEYMYEKCKKFVTGRIIKWK